MNIYPIFCLQNKEIVDPILDLINNTQTVEPVCSMEGQLKWAIQYVQATYQGPDEIWCYFDSKDSIYYLLNKDQNLKINKSSDSICSKE